MQLIALGCVVSGRVPESMLYLVSQAFGVTGVPYQLPLLRSWSGSATGTAGADAARSSASSFFRSTLHMIACITCNMRALHCPHHRAAKDMNVNAPLLAVWRGVDSASFAASLLLLIGFTEAGRERADANPARGRTARQANLV